MTADTIAVRNTFGQQVTFGITGPDDPVVAIVQGKVSKGVLTLGRRRRGELTMTAAVRPVAPRGGDPHDPPPSVPPGRALSGAEV